ncbi:MAG: twin-arginine translocase TatA/TatE family subunit [Faecalibacterium prausnitzii]|nr:twin-arginine translocase TatA/TatE family subunit [Faecalibacterium prausnitzii]MDY2683177.1 twin-arginine translocase TatA/TatE family subunit [Faecalibacterium prausnitzii]
MRIGTNELLIILVVALLIFGPKNLPKLGKMFGKTINGFKKGMEDEESADGSEEKVEKKAEKKDDEDEE